MPGPGAHFFYAMASGLALNSLSGSQFGAHHVLFYTIQAFFGPDIGVFTEWLFRENLHYFPERLSRFCESIHSPFGYMAWNVDFAVLYSWIISGRVLSSYALKLYSKASLTIIQCFLLGSAGGLSHFFLDYLFEHNSKELEWVLKTGDMSKQVYLESILVVLGQLSLLFLFFFYIYRFQPETPQASVQKSPPPQRSLIAALQSLIVGALRLLPFRMPTLETSAQRTSLPRTILAPIIAWFRSNFPELWFLKAFLVRSVRLTSFKMAVVLFLVASGYVKWLEFYKTSWKRPGIGEEADVGVIIFMAKYFVLPHLLCLLSMHRDQ